VIYFSYGRRHSKLRKEVNTQPADEPRALGLR
jgi:hypothetical protein